MRAYVSAILIAVLGVACFTNGAVQALPTTTGDIVWDGCDVAGESDNLWKDAYESDNTIWLWQESSVTLGWDVRLNYLAETGEPGDVAEGTEVCSFLLHYDTKNDNGLDDLHGSVTFDGEIIGVLYRHGGLIRTDDIFGQDGVNYWDGGTADTWRGIDGGDPDRFSISGNSMTLSADLWVKEQMDEIRIITTREACACVPDAGSTLLLLGLAVPLLALRHR